MELNLIQIILIGALIIILPLGLWNQQRMKKKKLEEELYGGINSTTKEGINNTSNFDESSISPQILEQAKIYIQTYKSQYPKESVEQGLIQLGITNEQAKELINKYWQ
ncbi:MAG: hypothetical protein LAT82_02310 [Nanoarchaeota archaeon]|nr:hypothetical protein [Nanoarchaeota archaeon]